ncbi:exonuclease domain-containing protein [Corynebacterium pacaense]|uniref:exonuclease domain-containing protein n=1 Tax=Corynebacterium pacaense TaxID=1816684 RepID=UPI0009BA2765|nr:exonuclease domain-containing protein [Corynebacterium pacaense]
MIAAHGADLTLGDSTLTISYSPLLTALSETGKQRVVIELSAVTGFEFTRPTALTCGDIAFSGAGDTVITFSPGQGEQAAALAADLERILNGEAPAPEAPTVEASTRGNSVAGFDVVGFDVETANDDWGSICQIGLVRYRDGRETDSASWLCAPPAPLGGFLDANIAIHGISGKQVENEPSFADRLPEMVDFVGDLPLIAHNAQFDFTALKRACAASGIDTPHMLFGCSLILSRVEKLQVANHKLPTVAAALGITLDNHHDATEDARASAEIAISLALQHHFTGSFIDFIHSCGLTLGSTDGTRVFPVLRDRSGAGVAAQRRALGLDTGAAPATRDTGHSGDAQDAGSKPAEQAKTSGGGRGPAPWAKVATPDTVPDPNPDADPQGILFGQNVTLTGDFEPYEKGNLWQRIADQGATVGKNVTKKTTILVAGPWDSITSKQKRAEELIEKGQKLEIWDEKQLFTALGLEEQPPF